MVLCRNDRSPPVWRRLCGPAFLVSLPEEKEQCAAVPRAGGRRASLKGFYVNRT